MSDRWTPFLAPAFGLGLLVMTAVLEHRLSRDPSVWVLPADISVRADPTILSLVGSRALADLTLADRPLPMQDKGLGPLLEARAKAHPLIVDAGPIERQFPGRVTMPVALRRPVAIVRYEGFALLVDAEGVVASRPVRVDPRARFPLPIIEPPADSMSAFPRRGHPFVHRHRDHPGHAAVREALNVINTLSRPELRDEPALKQLKVAVVSVGKAGAWQVPQPWRPGSPGITLHLSNGPDVYWGHCPDGPNGLGWRGEREKIRNLEILLGRPGGLVGISHIDATLPDGVIKGQAVR